MLILVGFWHRFGGISSAIEDSSYTCTHRGEVFGVTLYFLINFLGEEKVEKAAVKVF